MDTDIKAPAGEAEKDSHAGVRIIKSIRYTDARDARCAYDLYLPEGERPKCPVFVYFYGGGLEKGSKDKNVLFPTTLAQNGIAVAVPDYRLMPEVMYPVFIEDAAEAAAAVMKKAGGYVDPTGYFVGGHSAGAYLSMMLCFDKRYLAVHGVDSDALNGYIFIAGQPTKHYKILKYLGEDPRAVRIDDTCPLWYIRETGAPLLIITSENDMKNRREQNRLLYGTLMHYGYSSPVVYREYTCAHNEFTKAGEDGRIRCLDDVKTFIFQHG